jgi:hypothetical protein
MTRQMAMVGFLQAQNCTNLPSSWRHPESRDDSMSADYYQEIAGVLEVGKFHMAFFDDRLAMPDRYDNDHAHAVEYGIRCVKMDPVIVLTTHPGCKYRQIERAIEVFASVPNGGLVLPPNVTTTAHRDVIVALAARHHLPAVCNIRPFVTAGGLMSYGVDFTDVFRQAASVRGSRVKNDPGCVKTHTAAKCRKNNSPGGHHVSRVQ